MEMFVKISYNVCNEHSFNVRILLSVWHQENLAQANVAGRSRKAPAWD